MKARPLWVPVLLAIFTPSAWSAHFYYEGTVTDATSAMAILVPAGTEVSSVFEFSDTAVQSGEVEPSDVLMVDLRFGVFCFGHNSDCDNHGALVAFLILP